MLDATKNRRETIMLIILWILGALLALVVLAIVLLPIFIDEQALTELAAEQVRANTGGELVINGETDISFFSALWVATRRRRTGSARAN